MKRIFIRLLIWLCIFNIGLSGILGLSLKKARAAEPQAANITPIVQFVIASGQGSEKNPTPTIEVATSDILTSDISVDYSVTGGSAILGQNFDLKDGTLEIVAGQSLATIPLSIIDDGVVSADKSVEITLSNPINADLGPISIYTYTILEADSLPVTELITDPSLPNGQNSWFVNYPSITLKTTETTDKTYYQWGSTIDPTGWVCYTQPIVAPEGENTINYYSEDVFGNKEIVKWAIMKVDTIAPGSPTVNALVGDDGYITLSWANIDDTVGYIVWRTDSDKIAILTKDQLSYFDQNTVQGQTYQYMVMAIDAAGNYSAPYEVLVLVPVKVAINTEPDNTPVVSKAIQRKSISYGASTQKVSESTIVPSEETVETKKEDTKEVEGANDEANNSSNTETGRNWSQLLLAISILVIAAGAAIGGYYGYEWWMEKKNDKGNAPKPPKSKSRW